MLIRPRYIVISLLVLLVLVVLSLPSVTTSKLKLAIGGVFLPLFGLANSAHHLSAKAQTAVQSRQALMEQIDQLRQENRDLAVRAMQGEEAWRENNRLRDLLQDARQLPWKYKLARIIGRDPANWWRTVQIDRGTRDGLRANLTVIAPEGLVGRITEAGFNRSQVVLVGDPNCRVSAYVLSADGKSMETQGIIIPSTGDASDISLVDLTYVPGNSILKPGQTVKTSGQGGVYPAGLLIGKIVDTRRVESGIYLEARVKLAVNYNRLEEVLVLMP